MTLKPKPQNTVGGGLYIALAICVLSVICIGVYSAILNIFEPPVSTPLITDENWQETEGILPSPAPNQPNNDQPSATPPDDTPVEAPETTPDESVNSTPTPPGYTLPVAGGITKAFSHDVLVYSRTMNDYRVHNGVDLSAQVGTPVKAFTRGVVTEIYEDPLMGQTVVLDHGNGIISTYQNLSSSLPEGISVGVTVQEGQVIAGVGETVLIECAEEPHLHFEITVNGNYVDPMSYFS